MTVERPGEPVKACVAYACVHISAASPPTIVSQTPDELALELENRWTNRPWRDKNITHPQPQKCNFQSK